ncbi:MAG: endo-1,4-beta-xylanase [Phycisphaeraceae bacterium JB051]
MIKASVFTFLLGMAISSFSYAQSLPQPIQQAIDKFKPQAMLPQDALDHARLQQNAEGLGKVTFPEKGVVELVCEKTSSQVIDLQLVVNVPKAMQKGDTLLLVVKAQSIEHDRRCDFGLLFLNFERDVKWTKSLGYQVKLSKEPKLLAIPFQLREDTPAGEGRLTFPIGYFPQTLRLSELQLYNFGKQIAVDDLSIKQYAYEGHEPDAAWRKEAAKRIEQYRKAPLVVTVVDAQGQPLKDAAVHVQMQRHAFAFGTAVNEWKFVGDDSDRRIYKQKVAELFNTATLETGLKWLSWYRQGNRQRLDATMQWLADHDIAVRGHTMVWPSWKKSPKTLVEKLKADPQYLREQVLAYIEQVGQLCKDRVVEWDVLNEVHNNHDYLDVLGEEEIDTWFAKAREVDSDAPLFINEFGVMQGKGGYSLLKQDKHYQLIKRLLDRGVGIDGIGFQSHFRLYAVTPPKRVWEILDRYAQLGLKIGITEYDLAWVSEDFQAQYLHDFMLATFAHPSVNQFIMWGFWDGSHWREDGGMFAKDWREKPSLVVYKDLVFKQWWTDENKTTDSDGQIQTRGFLGQYQLTISAHGKSVTQRLTLPQQGSALTVVLP